MIRQWGRPGQQVQRRPASPSSVTAVLGGTRFHGRAGRHAKYCARSWPVIAALALHDDGALCGGRVRGHRAADDSGKALVCWGHRRPRAPAAVGPVHAKSMSSTWRPTATRGRHTCSLGRPSGGSQTIALLVPAGLDFRRDLLVANTSIRFYFRQNGIGPFGPWSCRLWFSAVLSGPVRVLAAKAADGHTSQKDRSNACAGSRSTED